MILLACIVWTCHTNPCVGFTFAAKVLVVVGHDFEEIGSGVDCRLLPSSMCESHGCCIGKRRKLLRGMQNVSKRPCVESIKLLITIEARTLNTLKTLKTLNTLNIPGLNTRDLVNFYIHTIWQILRLSRPAQVPQHVGPGSATRSWSRPEAGGMPRSSTVGPKPTYMFMPADRKPFP